MTHWHAAGLIIGQDRGTYSTNTGGLSARPGGPRAFPTVGIRQRQIVTVAVVVDAGDPKKVTSQAMSALLLATPLFVYTLSNFPQCRLMASTMLPSTTIASAPGPGTDPPGPGPGSPGGSVTTAGFR